MPLVAVESCQFVDTTHGGQCEIVDGLSTNEKIDGKKICLDGLTVRVSGGTSPGPQVGFVDVVFASNIIKNCKYGDKLPLAVGETSSGKENGSYVVVVPVSLPVVLQIVDAGQTDVQVT